VISVVPGVDYHFEDPGLLHQALTHKSRGRCNYERLEFLGDSILNLVISKRLFEVYPKASEGDLSRMRARIVRGNSLSEVAKSLDLGKHLKLGAGEMKSGGFRRSSILADALEGLLGAIFLDGGYPACHEVILELFDPMIRDLPSPEELKDAKTRLQELLQAQGRPLPVYQLERQEGADHARNFHVLCFLSDESLQVRAEGNSRRKAEQQAAGEMLALVSAHGGRT